MKMELKFVKMEGIGNDFILIDDREQTIEKTIAYTELARHLCDRHFGIGADGILLILPSTDHDFKFRIFNSDGSSAQMCGNGIRCVARYVYENGIVANQTMTVDTLAGTVVPQVLVDGQNQVISVRVDMGEPVLQCDQIPFVCDQAQGIEQSLQVGDTTYQVTTVSMGNPHAVLFVDDIDPAAVGKIGPAIETHDRFPEKTNVEFIQVLGPDELSMNVWERGAGITLACGTGACASLVAAHLTGRTGSRALVHLAGGDLEISWDKKSNHLFMEGPATLVFEGKIQVD